MAEQMMMQKGDSTTPLPLQLLARILQLVDLQTRLQTCALVCRSWHKATVLSVRDIALDDCTSEQAAGLSAWLSAHGSEAQITSIAVTSAVQTSPGMHHLVLPVQQLSQLRDLKLWCVQASAVDARGSAAPLFGSHGGVTGLTRLELYNSYVSLQGLRSCTALQHLDFRPPSHLKLAGLSADVSHLLEALPHLSSRLTFLQLLGPTCPDRLMLQLSSLHALRELYLEDVACTTASFSSLPSGLTSLSVSLSPLEASGAWSAARAAARVFSPSTTPGVCQLTALQDLTVSEARAADVALLTVLTQLSRLQLLCTPLISTAGGPTLRALSALTQLRHVALHSLGDPKLDSPEQLAPAAVDYAALTASQQLTYLELPAGIDPQRGAELFPPGVQLHQLEELVLPFELFRDAIVSNAVKACTALKRLGTEVWHDDDGVLPHFAESDPLDMSALARLTGLGALTSLTLDAHALYMDLVEWGALARLTGLHELAVGVIKAHCVDGFGQLKALRQLTNLWMSWHTHDVPASFDVINTAPAGSPSNLWRQLPTVAPRLLGPCLEVDTVDPETRCCIMEVFWASLENHMHKQQDPERGWRRLHQQQEQELMQLRQRVGDLEAQVAGLQAELAAVRL